MPISCPYAQVGADQLRKAGLNVDVQTMDFTTMVRRRASKEPPDKGGWNVFFTFTDGLFSDNPATNIRRSEATANPAWKAGRSARSWRRCATPGWRPADIDAQKRICEQMQLQMWQDVPYIPMGFWVRSDRAPAQHRRSALGICRVLWGAKGLTSISCRQYGTGGGLIPHTTPALPGVPAITARGVGVPCHCELTPAGGGRPALDETSPCRPSPYGHGRDKPGHDDESDAAANRDFCQERSNPHPVAHCDEDCRA